MKPALQALITTRRALRRSRSSRGVSGRPTDPAGFIGYGYGTDAVKAYAGASVVVHYATTGTHAVDATSTRADGVPDTVAYAADRGDEALSHYAGWGYRTVPSDVGCPSNGGDEKVDIYLVSFSAASAPTARRSPSVPAPGTCSSFVLVESRFVARRPMRPPRKAFGPSSPVSSFTRCRTYVRPHDAGFWARGHGAVGDEDRVPGSSGLRGGSSGVSSPSRRGRSTRRPRSVTAGFSLWLGGVAALPSRSASAPTSFTTSLRRRGAGAASDDVMVVIDNVLKTKGSSLANEYPLFGAWNVGTKGFASARLPRCDAISGAQGGAAVGRRERDQRGLRLLRLPRDPDRGARPSPSIRTRRAAPASSFR